MTDKKDVDAAIQLATDKATEYQVQGYGRQDDGYGGPYHPDAFQDPKVHFALGGAPEAQEKFSKELRELDEAKAKDKDSGIDKVDIVAGSAHSTVVQLAPYRAAAATPELEATVDNVEEAAARKHLVVPRSDETQAEATKKVAAKKTQAAKDTAKRRTDADNDRQTPAEKKSTPAPAKKTAAKKAAPKRSPKFDK